MCDTANRNAERQRHSVGAQEPIGENTMTEEKAGKKTTATSDNVQPAVTNGLATIESFLPHRFATTDCGRHRGGSGRRPDCCYGARFGPGSARWGSRLHRVPRDFSRSRARRARVKRTSQAVRHIMGEAQLQRSPVATAFDSGGRRSGCFCLVERRSCRHWARLLREQGLART